MFTLNFCRLLLFFLHGAGQIIRYLPADCFYRFNKLLLFFFLPSHYVVYVYTYNTKSINRSSRNIPFFQNFTKEQDIKKEPKTEVHEPQSIASRKAFLRSWASPNRRYAPLLR